MTPAVKKVFEQVLALSDDERDELQEALGDDQTIESIELSEAWTSEIKDRIEEIRSGKVEPVSLSELDAQIQRTLQRHRE